MGGEPGALVPNLLHTVPNLLERRAMRWRMQGSFQRDGAVGRVGGEAGAIVPNLLHTVDAFSDYFTYCGCIT